MMLSFFRKITIGQTRNVGPLTSAAIHTTAALPHKRVREQMIATSVKKEDGTRGESSIDIDNLVARYMFHAFIQSAQTNRYAIEFEFLL